MHVVSTLAPVFLLIALGAALMRGRFMSQEAFRAVNRLVYWFALPALLFRGTATAEFHPGEVSRLIVVVIAASFVAWGCGWACGRGLGLNTRQLGTFMHVSFRGNTTFIGLPVLYYAMEGRNLVDAAGLGGTALVVLGPLLLFQNVFGTFVLLSGRGESGRRLAATLFKEISTHPLLISLVLGLAWGGMGWRIPMAMDRTLVALGGIALPAALIGIGGALLTVKIRGNRRTALLASLIKVLLAPCVGWVIGQWLGLVGHEMLIALVYLACPTGASSFTVVSEMGGDEAIASTSIALSTVLSIVPLAIIAGWF